MKSPIFIIFILIIINYSTILADSLSQNSKLTTGYNKSYALCIGINNYSSYPALNSAVNDAQSCAKLFKRIGFGSVTTLVDSEATQINILKEMDKLSNLTTVNDRVVVYFSGHGDTEQNERGENLGYLIPFDYPQNGSKYLDAISMIRLKEASKRIKGKHILYLIDSCYSGTGLMESKGDDSFIAESTLYPVTFMITAGKNGEKSLESEGHGLFTSYLLKAFEGRADIDRNGIITTSEIGNYVKKWVSFKAKNDFKLEQNPQYGKWDGDGEIIFELDKFVKLEDEMPKTKLGDTIPPLLISTPTAITINTPISERVKSNERTNLELRLNNLSEEKYELNKEIQKRYFSFFSNLKIENKSDVNALFFKGTSAPKLFFTTTNSILEKNFDSIHDLHQIIKQDSPILISSLNYKNVKLEKENGLFSEYEKRIIDFEISNSLSTTSSSVELEKISGEYAEMVSKKDFPRGITYLTSLAIGTAAFVYYYTSEYPDQNGVYDSFGNPYTDSHPTKESQRIWDKKRDDFNSQSIIFGIADLLISLGIGELSYRLLP